ncbi:hypothetical protein GCM10017687_30660 [Streptomyces echinatus]
MALTTRRRALTTLGAALTGTLVLPAGQARGRGTRAPPGRCGPPTPTTTTSTRGPCSTPSTTASAASKPTSSSSAASSSSATTPPKLDPSRTLESLYLEPLAALVKAHHGSVYRGRRRALQLLVDIKTEGLLGLPRLDRRLRRHPHLFTRYAHGRVHPGPVTVVVSGDRAARTPMEAQTSAAPSTTAGSVTSAPRPRPPSSRSISDNWTQELHLGGRGCLPDAERQKLRGITGAAHARRQRIRFLGTPDTAGPARDALWTELLAAGVDYLNTDDLAGLEAFLDARPSV